MSIVNAIVATSVICMGVLTLLSCMEIYSMVKDQQRKINYILSVIRKETNNDI